MNIAAVIIVLILLVAYYMYATRLKPLTITGYADDEVSAYLNDTLLFLNKGWNKKFTWTGEAKSKDNLKFVVKNIGGSGGLVCMLDFDGQVAYSNPTMFQSTEAINKCPPGGVNSWWRENSLDGMEQAEWIWTGSCVDRLSVKTNTFNYVLP